MSSEQEDGDLVRLTYASVLNANQTHDGRKRIREVIEESRYRNIAKNISGMLFYDEATQRYGRLQRVLISSRLITCVPILAW